MSRDRAERWAAEAFRTLSPSDKWELQDALVLGSYEWSEWFTQPPPRGGTSVLSRKIQLWEEART